MNKSESPTLRELREQNKRSREEVAAALGVTANALTNYECGIRRISAEAIYREYVKEEISKLKAEKTVTGAGK